MLVARLEAPDLTLGFIVRDGIRLPKLTRKTGAPAGNQVQMSAREAPPVCLHFAPELLPGGFHEIPVNQESPPDLGASLVRGDLAPPVAWPIRTRRALARNAAC